MSNLNSLYAGKPFDLFIGRKRQRITRPWRFEADMAMSDITDDLMPAVSYISHFCYRLFIDDKLYLTVNPPLPRKYGRPPVRMIKPKHGRSLELRFVKKYTTIH